MKNDLKKLITLASHIVVAAPVVIAAVKPAIDALKNRPGA